MKKVFAFISILAVACAAMFAEVTAKKLADGKVEATFFYGNPRATEVLLAGSFTDWQNGALPMEKGDKGFTLTKVFDAGTTVKYKFISDGNWTTDLKAPDFCDDGFGGKNSLADLDEIAGGADAGKVKYPNVKFNTWSMLGMQGKFSTVDAADATTKETNLENIAVMWKSYDKLNGYLTPNMPFYVEIALSENDTENVKLYDRNNKYDDNVKLLKNFVGNVVSNPNSYIGDETATKGWGNPAKLGHIKFGWETPYVNFTTGYNYAKLPKRQAITWFTVNENWDAGYEHEGGFALYELGEKLQKVGDYTLTAGLNLNKTGDRKGRKYGAYAFANLDTGAWKFDAQWNAMYGSDYLFYDPIEHDVIVGAKGKVGDITLAAQALLAIHDKDIKDTLGDDYAHASDGWKSADAFGYSTDVFYRNGGVDGIENLAGNVQAGYKNDTLSVNAEYRFRGLEASMLWTRNNHDDDDLKLTDMLGNINSQRIKVDTTFNASEMISVGLTAQMETELKNYDATDDEVVGVQYCTPAGYASGKSDAYFLDDFGAEFEFVPSVTVTLDDTLNFKSSVKGYATLNYASYKELGAADDFEYAASDSKFLFKNAGIIFSAEKLNDTISGLDVYYGLDNEDTYRLFNTLVAKVGLPGSVEASAGVGLRTWKSTDAVDLVADKDVNNPFGFALGVSKKLNKIMSPTVYAQFMWNMDPYKGFGDGPANLNLKDANLGADKYNTAVNRYDGLGALRVGMHWDF